MRIFFSNILIAFYNKFKLKSDYRKIYISAHIKLLRAFLKTNSLSGVFSKELLEEGITTLEMEILGFPDNVIENVFESNKPFVRKRSESRSFTQLGDEVTDEIIEKMKLSSDDDKKLMRYLVATIWKRKYIKEKQIFVPVLEAYQVDEICTDIFKKIKSEVKKEINKLHEQNKTLKP